MYELTKNEKHYLKALTYKIKKSIPYSTIWGSVCRQDSKYIEISVNTSLLGTKTFYIYRRIIHSANIKSHVFYIVTLYLRDSIICIVKERR